MHDEYSTVKESDEDRVERAIRYLKRLSLFQGVSRRLLADMVAQYGFKAIEPKQPPLPESSLMVLLDAVEGTSIDGRPTFMPRGAYIDPQIRLDALDIGGATSGPLALMLSPEEMASLPPALLSSMNLDTVSPPLRDILTNRRVPERIWVTCEPGRKLPMLALAFALAEEVARHTPYPTVLIVFKAGKMLVHTWCRGSYHVTPELGPIAPITDLCELLGTELAICTPGDTAKLKLHGRVFVTSLDDPLRLPAEWTLRFHRIVQLLATLPDKVPSAVLDRLVPEVQGNDEYYACYNATIVGGPRRQPSDDDEDGDDGFTANELQRPGVLAKLGCTTGPRILRDAVRMRMNMISVEKRWNARVGDEPFLPLLRKRDRRRVERWARTITLRRVGVALSGGGAASYRAAELFAALERADVPVDVVAGLSGGALVGAYYCWGGLKALDTAIKRGSLFQLVLPLVFASSAPLQLLVDHDCDSACVEDMETRFVAIATRLAPGEEPRSVAVTKGTLGRAVRVSGCLPPGFAPTWIDDARYTDGGAATAVPARIARDFGADAVIACSVIPGPARSNPFDDHPLGRLVHRYTPVGRVIDLWAWYAHLWNETSRQFGEDADVYLEFEPDSLPFLETFEWWNADGIRRRAGKQRKRITGCVEKFRERWMTLQPSDT